MLWDRMKAELMIKGERVYANKVVNSIRRFLMFWMLSKFSVAIPETNSVRLTSYIWIFFA